MDEQMKTPISFIKISRTVVAILYIPLSLFSFLMYMASEATIGATNPVFIGLINVFCVITLSMPLICCAGVAVSGILQSRKRRIASVIVLLVPMVVFILNNLLLAYAQTLPPKI